MVETVADEVALRGDGGVLAAGTSTGQVWLWRVLAACVASDGAPCFGSSWW